jgi:hypothetical protein
VGARETDDRTARRQGPPKGSKLDPHRDYLLALIEATPDLTISELLAKLLEERQVRAARATLWVFLDRCGPTFKTYGPPRLQGGFAEIAG